MQGGLTMTEVHYGVVRVGDHWAIVGENLRFGAYETRSEAQAAVRRLAAFPAGLGLPVMLHEQEDDWVFPGPTLVS
ncbi:hypothetical protein OVA11_00920 [Caulobacter sp. SL161]|uniref:hypothetical protein n=1 Tax=Caulobacter sp. SL161 TaxID=2995156 RepID=UPI0022752B6D|nr:hypothetical protein [Caulobacter sp. SL161]MCY1645676.1 hypothetical protein [Caulobacter sp. SL161]